MRISADQRDEHLYAEWSENKAAVGQYLAFLASERYYSSTNRWPGTSSDASEQQQLEALVQASIGKSSDPLPDEVTEGIAEV
jgi:hypothetical protein